MAVSNKATWQDMQSKIMKMGYGSNVVIGEPREGQSGMIAIIPDGGEIDEVTLSQPREIHRFKLRMYQNWQESPQEEIEFVLDQFRADILAKIAGNFTLGSTISYVMPTEFTWDHDEPEVGDIRYRVINLNIAYRIDERATHAA